MEKKKQKTTLSVIYSKPQNDTPGYLHPLNHSGVRDCRHKYQKGLKKGSLLV